MCGFVGFWQFKFTTSQNLNEIALKMASEIDHRGPDSAGVWQDQQVPLVLAHQRLAIRDLSSHGVQPMHSKCGRWVIAYNGEIYNCEALVDKNFLREEMNDTAVLIEAISQNGLESTLNKVNGMFAFALWDKQEKSLYLVRDRLGIKPLYWGFNRGILYFGSQMKSFRKHPNWSPSLDKSALSSYFRVNYINAPHTIYENINKLKPGTYVKVDMRGDAVEKTYWSLLNFPRREISSDPVQSLHDLLKDSVKRRMISDVPLGAFLSGGIDSSLVVSLMQSQSTNKIKTFSIGFNEAEFNEACYAKRVANYLGTDHHELYFSEQDAINLIPSLTKWYDEPFADSSQLPTLLVSSLAKKHVTVSLSGDGGDELFAGYTRYFTALNLYNKLAILPKPLRLMIANGINLLSPKTWNKLATLVPKKLRPPQVGDKAHKFSRLLKNSPDDFYTSLVSLWHQPQTLLLEGEQEYAWPEVCGDSFVKYMQLLDTLTYLPEDILTKVDRASMAYSLEARVPILDYRVVEFAFSLPKHFLIRKNQGKWILRQLLNQYLPQALIDRPKMGFGVPIGQWLRTNLREWAEELLRPSVLQSSGLNPEPIRQKWQQHLSGVRNWQYPLWGVLMFQMWYEDNK